MKPIVKLLFILGFMSLLCFASEVQAQTGNVFKDVADIKKFLESDQKDKLISYLKTLGVSTKKSDLQANPYLALYFRDALFDSATGELLTSRAIMNIDDIKAESRSGGVFETILPPTQTIDALGTFVAKRFKEEVTIAYLAKFREFIEKDIPINGVNYPLIKTLFPETYRVLQSVEPYNYTVFLETLRQAFDKDLEVLPAGVIEVIKLVPGVAINADLKSGILLFSATLQESIKGNNMIQILNDMGTKPEVNMMTDEPKKVLRLTSLVSRNVFYKNGINYEAVEHDEIIKILEDKNLIYLSMGLLMEKEKTQLNSIDPSIYTTLNDTSKARPIIQYVNKISNDLSVASGIAESIRRAKRNGVSVSINDYLTYVENIISITNSSYEISKVVINFTPTAISTIDNVLIIGKTTFSLSRSIFERKYGLALMNAVDLIKKSVPNSAFKDDIVKYGTFMVTMATAKTSDQMVAALESAALPVGSYRIKRNNLFTISINAFGGVYGGYEFLDRRVDDPSKKAGGKNGWIGGPSAPIGIFAGFGRSQEKVKNTGGHRPFTLGLFIPLIDVGSVFAFRLNPDNTALLPELSWKNVFSPGAYIVWGPFKGPITFAFGYQRGPELRKIVVTDNTTTNSTSAVIGANASRLSLSVTCDIALFNLYTKR